VQSAVSYSRLIALYVRGAMLSVRTFIDGVRDNSFVTSCRPTIEYKFLRVLFSDSCLHFCIFVNLSLFYCRASCNGRWRIPSPRSMIEVLFWHGETRWLYWNSLKDHLDLLAELTALLQTHTSAVLDLYSAQRCFMTLHYINLLLTLTTLTLPKGYG